MAKTSILKLVFVDIWSVTPTFYFFLIVSHLEKNLGFIEKKILIAQTQRKP